MGLAQKRRGRRECFSGEGGASRRSASHLGVRRKERTKEKDVPERISFSFVYDQTIAAPRRTPPMATAVLRRHPTGSGQWPPAGDHASVGGGRGRRGGGAVGWGQWMEGIGHLVKK